MHSYRWLLVCLLGLLVIQPAGAQVDLDPFVRKESFGDIKLSPDGDYYAATVPLEDKTGLVVMRRSDHAVTARFALVKNTHIEGFWWVNPSRVLISISQKSGLLDTPRLTGELFAVDADGKNAEMLVGYRVQSQGAGTRIQPKKVEDVAAFLVDPLENDDRNVIIEVSPFGEDTYSRAEKMDVYSGRRTLHAKAPVRRASFVTDNNGVVRFASGAGSDNVRKLYYRDGEGAEWALINDQSVSGIVENAIGFSADNSIAYLVAEQPKGPDKVVAFDPKTGKREVVLLDDGVDPVGVVYEDGIVGLDLLLSPAGKVPLGVRYMDGKPRLQFFDDSSKTTRLYRTLESAFPGQSVGITSTSTDGKVALVEVSSDRNPGDFYLFDTADMKANYLLSRSEWFDPDNMAEVRPFDMKARDGLKLSGYLTLPPKSPGKNLPLVVMPHGGPFGVADKWAFDKDAQMLAQAGYAVLQVNFRGSGGRGRDFQAAGARQWGLKMQDDVTDATRWAIESGVADPERICIYGASYGAYAALTGVAKEPGLYKCAVGYVGVYDLPTMHMRGDIQEQRSGETYLRQWVGERNELAAVSPTNMANRIKVPVFLAAGGEDERTPIEHSKMMERRLKTAGVPVETLYYDTEGHGFYTEPHRREFYAKLLDFLARNIGGAKAK